MMMMINELGLYKRLMTAVVLSCALTGALGAVAEDGYIESYGTGSICLGHFAGPNTKIEVDMEMKELVNGTRLFGGYGDHSTSPTFFLYFGTISSSDTRIRYSWDTSSTDSARMAWNMDVASVGDRRTISFDAPTKTYTSIPHGESTGYSYTFSKAVLNKTSSYPLAVFGSSIRGYGASTNDFTVKTWPVRMKCYGVKIYESGTLVKNFVPCVKGGIAGLKETFSNRFVSGVNIKDVGYGGDILVEKDDPYISTIVNTNNLFLSGMCLPGTSIGFKTGYYMKKNSRLELDYALLSPDWSPDRLHSGFMHMLTAGTSDGYKMYVATYGSAASRGEFYISLNASDSAPDIRLDTACDVRRTVTVSSNMYAFVTAGYTNVSWTTTGGIKKDQDYYQVKVACNQNGTGGFTPMKIYGLKIYESDALIKDFKPFVTNGVPGLIDTLHPSDRMYAFTYHGDENGSSVTNKTNRMAEGGGDFDAYTASAEREAYLEFPATGSGINTGYKAKHDAVIEADFALCLAQSPDGQVFIKQESNPYITLSSAGNPKTYWWKYADTAGGTDGFTSPVPANERRQYRLDKNTMTIKRGDETISTRNKNWTCTTESGSETLKIGSSNAAMRLYSFKIIEGGVPVRNYVPCVTNGVAGLYELHTNTFFPLTGGMVSGKGYKGQTGEFEIAPQPATLTHSDGLNSTTLTCLAAGAQSYEWYEDGVKVDETSDSLTLIWNRAKAKADNHVHTYSVKPVYTVFNEKVKGHPVTATVEYTPLGTIIRIR